MIAKEFPEANVNIAETQDEFQTLPAKITEYEQGAVEVIACFELEENELKQIQETGCIWLTFLQPKNSGFHPIGMNCLKPEMK